MSFMGGRIRFYDAVNPAIVVDLPIHSPPSKLRPDPAHVLRIAIFPRSQNRGRLPLRRPLHVPIHKDRFGSIGEV